MGDHGVPSREGLLDGYRVLSERRQGNFDLQWRAPSYAIGAQAFLFLVVAEPTVRPVIRLVTGCLIAIIGVISILVMVRLDMLQRLDGFLLDAYEEALLSGSYRQGHAQLLVDRLNEPHVEALVQKALGVRGRDSLNRANAKDSKVKAMEWLITPPYLRHKLLRGTAMRLVKKYTASRFWECGLGLLSVAGFGIGLFSMLSPR